MSQRPKRFLRKLWSQLWPAFLAGGVIMVLLAQLFPERIFPEGFLKRPVRNLQLARELLDETGRFQMSLLNSLDQKATALLTTNGILLGFGLVQQGKQLPDRVLLYVALALLLLGLVSGSAVLILPRRLAFPLLERKFLGGDYRKARTEAMLLNVVTVLDEIRGTNDKQRGRKQASLIVQFCLLLAGAIVLAASYVVRAIGS